MKINSVRTTPEGSPQPAIVQWTVTKPVGELPQRFFRRELFVRFANPEGSDRIVIDASATRLRVKFLNFDYDALNPGDDFPAGSIRFVDSSHAAIVELDAPREFMSVGFSTPTILGSRALELYRVDGEAIADKPTLTQTGGLFDLELATATLDGSLAMEALGGEVPVESSRPGPGAINIPRAEPFVDARFAFRFSTGETLDPTKVQRVNMRGRPTAPRVGIVTPGAQPETVQFSRPEAGALFNAGEALAAELNRFLERLAVMPANLQLSIVFDSDEPCRVEVSQFEIVYRLLRESFPGGEEKQVLRFGGGALESREVTIQVPGNASVISASLEIQDSFGSDRPAGAGASALEGSVGVELGPDNWAAQSFTPQQAITVNGIALAVAGLEPAAELLVKLREDWRSGPGGSTLGEGKLKLPEAGLRQWLTASFQAPVILNSRPYWILVKAAGGSAVWLASEGSEPARVLAQDGASFTEIGVLAGDQGLFYFLSSQDGLAAQPPVRAAIGSQAIAEEPAPPGARRVFDLSAALGTLVPAPESTGEVSVPVVFSSEVPGSISVYPPRVEYEFE